MRVHILVIEDDPVIGPRMQGHLAARVAPSVTLCVDLASAEGELLRADLVVLDLTLPDVQGLETLGRVRARAPSALVIIVTARGSLSERIEGLRAGADDYLVKPFSLLELEARVGALLRRRTPASSSQMSDLVWDRGARVVLRDGAALPLTPLEYAVFCALAARPGRALSREQLLREVIGPNFYGYERVIDVHVGHLRKKLDPEDTFRYIATVRHYGYRWDGREIGGEVRHDPA